MFTHMQNQLWQLTRLSPCVMGILMTTQNTKLDMFIATLTLVLDVQFLY